MSDCILWNGAKAGKGYGVTSKNGEQNHKGYSMATSMNYTEHLYKIDCSQHIEKKNGLSYLSWAWAWTTVLKIDPSATWIAQEYGQQGQELPFMSLPDGSAMVKVSVTIKGQTKSCMLPVMNHRNQAIKSPDAFAVNTSIMRCMVKAIAMHGLGLFIYAGEDLPEEPKQEPADVNQSIEVLKHAPTVEALNAFWKAEVSKFDPKGEDYKALKVAASEHKSFLQEMAVSA